MHARPRSSSPSLECPISHSRSLLLLFKLDVILIRNYLHFICDIECNSELQVVIQLSYTTWGKLPTCMLLWFFAFFRWPKKSISNSQCVHEHTNSHCYCLTYHSKVAKILVESGKILTCQDLAQSSVAAVARCLRLSIGFEKQVILCPSIHF